MPRNYETGQKKRRRLLAKMAKDAQKPLPKHVYITLEMKPFTKPIRPGVWEDGFYFPEDGKWQRHFHRGASK